MRKNKRLEKERAQCKNNENKFPANKEAEFTKYKKLVTEDITNIPSKKFLLLSQFNCIVFECRVSPGQADTKFEALQDLLRTMPLQP